jgi:Gpi18-like mannosyltransferase
LERNVTQRIKGILHSPDWRFCIILFLGLRFGLWGWMLLVRSIVTGNQPFDQTLHPYLGITPESNLLLEVWQRWDVLHYQLIAANGYNNSALEPFGPLYPMLMRWSAPLLGNNSLLAGLLISSLFCLAAMAAFINLARMELGTGDKARNAVLYQFIFPTAFFLMAPYTESIFLLGAIMTITTLNKKKWVQAGIWGCLAASARLPAAMIIIPAIYAAWRDWRESGHLRAWISPVMILGGAGLFPLYIWMKLGLQPWTFFHALDSGFQRTFNFPGFNIWLAIQNIFQGIYPLVNIPDLIFCILFIAGTILVWNKLPPIYGIFTTSFMLLYLSTNTYAYPLLSISRYTLVLFPVFLAMPTIIKSRKTHLMMTICMMTGLLFFSAQFAIWGWVG